MILNDVPRSSNRRCNHRSSDGHPFDDHDPEGFRFGRGVYHNIAGRHDVKHVVAITEELNRPAQRFLGGKPVQLGAVSRYAANRVVPND